MDATLPDRKLFSCPRRPRGLSFAVRAASPAEELWAWQEELEIADNIKGVSSKGDGAAALKKVKQLAKELRRKDKALAAAAA
jgi:hypothetical protein